MGQDGTGQRESGLGRHRSEGERARMAQVRGDGVSGRRRSEGRGGSGGTGQRGGAGQGGQERGAGMGQEGA